MRHRAWGLALVVSLWACTPTTGGFGASDGGMPADTSTSAASSDGVDSGSSTGSASSTDGATSAGTTGSSSGGTTRAAEETTTDTSSTGSPAESSSGGPPPQSLPEHPCSEEGTLASISSDTASEITWHNESGEVRRVYWLDYAGDRLPYGQLEPAAVAFQATFATHPWLIADEMDECVTIFVAQPGSHDIVLY